MASGTGYQYLSSGRYLGEEGRAAGLAYSPSNILWVEMLNSQAGVYANYTVDKIAIRRGRAALRLFEDQPDALANIENNMDGVVGNVAGIFVKKRRWPLCSEWNSSELL